MLKKQVRADFFGTKMKWPLWKDKWVNLHNGLNLFYKLNLLISTGDNSYLPGLIPLWCVLKQCLLWNLIVYLAFPATELKFVSTPSILWYIEDITRWREDMNFMFEWQEQYLTRSLRSLVRYTKAKGGNRDVIERYDTHKGDIRKIRHSGPGWSGVWNLEWFSSQ